MNGIRAIGASWCDLPTLPPQTVARKIGELEILRRNAYRRLKLDAEPLAEMLARLIHSMVLTPEGRIPTRDERQMRAFARTYLVPWLRV